MVEEAKTMQLQMANQYLRVGRDEQALPLLKSVLTMDPADRQAVRWLVQLYMSRGQSDLARGVLERAATAVPQDAELQRRLAATLAGQGHFEAAVHAYRRALALRPGWTDIYLKIALITRFTSYSGDVRAMEAQFETAPPDSQARRSLAFALGKVFDDLGRYAEAFGYFAEGNRIARLANEGSFAAELRSYRAIQDFFDTEYLRRHAGAGCPDASPVFITGLPRSGTTLVERILASHPRVHGGGELMDLVDLVTALLRGTGRGFPAGVAGLQPGQLHAAGAEYVRRIRRLAPQADLITNKGVATGVYIGLLGVMLPNARVIVCSRDPRDQCLSFFQHDFGGSLGYYYDLAELGQRHTVYHDLIAHWERVRPDSLLRVQYESLVADPEPQIRRVLDHCGLDFDPACLAFHRSKEPVSTLSLAQVRQPISTRAVGRWRNYAGQLQPLFAALGQAAGGSDE